jgi:hypothetical protein
MNSDELNKIEQMWKIIGGWPQITTANNDDKRRDTGSPQ